MASTAFVTGIIARRLGYSQVNAAAIVSELTADDCEMIELAIQHRGATVQIAAVIMAARMRRANKCPDVKSRLAAMAAAAKEADRHAAIIAAEPVFEHPKDVVPRRREVGLRIVLAADLLRIEDNGA